MKRIKILLIPLLIFGLFLSCDDGSSSITDEDAAEKAAEFALQMASLSQDQSNSGISTGVSRALEPFIEDLEIEEGLSFSMAVDWVTGEVEVTMVFTSYIIDDVTIDGTLVYNFVSDSNSSIGNMTGSYTMLYEGETYNVTMDLITVTSVDPTSLQMTISTNGSITCNNVTFVVDESETFSA